MKILVVSQHYYPENFRVNDICESLVKMGHSVDVVCGLPNYPEGKVLSEYKHKKNREQIINGVKLHRCFEIGRRKGVIFRFLNYYSVCLSMKKKAKAIMENFDVVLIVETSPIMVAWAGIEYAKLHKVPCILYCCDIWPDCLSAGGISKGSPIYNYFFKVSQNIYKSVDKILVSSKSFIPYFEENFGIKNVVYLPQYCEDVFNDIPTKDKDSKTFDYTFAGNIGKIQSVQTIIKAANIVKDRKEIKIHIIGDGSDLANCKKLAKELGADNVIFYGRKQLCEMPKYYGNSDAMIVTFMNEDIISKTLPAKVQSYMAAGKPIIASCGGETPIVIKEANAGLCCNAEDYISLSKLFILMTKENREVLGNNSKKYYQENFTKQLFFEKLFNEIQSLI